MRVWLTPELAQQLATHACAETPHECCGVLVGQGGDVREAIPVENVSPTPQTAFVMSPVDLARALTGLEKRGLALVGFYHSHPQTEPIPSGRDVAESLYPDVAHLIISLKDESSPAVMAWRIGVGEVERLELFIQSARPLDTDSEPVRLSGFQRAMTVIGGLVAAAVVIITALSLLPPPPLLK
jgi:proteasome lid subunit RPN8/RPN11